jgi:hypothetical protein
MSYRITIDTPAGKMRVTGYITSNPHIWITKNGTERNPFTLTHRPSGRALVSGLRSLEIADFAWQVVRQFPVDWSTKEPDMGKYYPVLKAVHDSFKKVPA